MDREGDEGKKPDFCKEKGISRCPNMKETYSDFEGERYRCDVCGASYYLDYEEMK
jgi:hypothetical protein